MSTLPQPGLTGIDPTVADTATPPLVSVCISAFNVEPVLRETLDSIAKQTYRRLEIILVDNGSTDRTYDLAQAFRDDRFRCFRIPDNIGGYQAMNLVARQAQGELVAIYHSDDVYEPTIIENEVAYLRSRPNVGAVFTMCHFMDEAGRIYGGLDLPAALARHDYLTYDEVFPYMLRHGNVMFPCPAFMVRRSVFADVGPFDADRWDIAADQEMWLRLLRRYPVGVLNERLFRYRHRRQQWTQRWRRLRTEPDRSVEIMELYAQEDNWRSRLPASAFAELDYQRCDDETTRAANAVILGETAAAKELLKGSYPYATLLNGVRRRKLRVLLLRGVMKAAFALGAVGPLGSLLSITEYRQRP